MFIRIVNSLKDCLGSNFFDPIIEQIFLFWIEIINEGIMFDLLFLS